MEEISSTCINPALSTKRSGSSSSFDRCGKLSLPMPTNWKKMLWRESVRMDDTALVEAIHGLGDVENQEDLGLPVHQTTLLDLDPGHLAQVDDTLLDRLRDVFARFPATLNRLAPGATTVAVPGLEPLVGRLREREAPEAIARHLDRFLRARLSGEHRAKAEPDRFARLLPARRLHQTIAGKPRSCRARSVTGTPTVRRNVGIARPPPRPFPWPSPHRCRP